MNNTPEKSLSLAKQGNIEAINTCLTYILRDLEITVRCSLKKPLIELIIAKPDGIPEQDISYKYIKNFFRYLKIPALHHVKIYAKQSPTNSLAWSREFYLEQIENTPSFAYHSDHSYIQTNTKTADNGLGVLPAYIQIEIPPVIAFEQLPTNLQHNIKRAGLRKGEFRSWQEAKEIYQTMPENIRRQGIENIDQYKRSHDWSHKTAHAKGGSHQPHNGDWENPSINRSRGSENMTYGENKALLKAKSDINFQAGTSIVLNKAIKSGGIAFGVELAFSGLDNFLAVQRGEKSVEAGLIDTLSAATCVAVTAAVVTGGIVAISLVFPPVGAVGVAVAPVLQIVGVAAGVQRLINILVRSKKVEGIDQLAIFMASYGLDEMELDFMDLEADAELQRLKLGLV
jgi:hypothetical protein